MGIINSRRNSGAPEVDNSNGSAYRYPPKTGTRLDSGAGDGRMDGYIYIRSHTDRGTDLHTHKWRRREEGVGSKGVGRDRNIVKDLTFSIH